MVFVTVFGGFNLSEFELPCVLDLKMGRQSYCDGASPDKVAKEKAKYPPQEAVGFRFAGMRGYVSGDLVESTREWCFSLQPDQIPDALESALMARQFVGI